MTENRERIERRIKREDFANQYKKLIKYCKRDKCDHTDYKTPEGRLLVWLARKELGYSRKTYDGDIYWNILKTKIYD